MAWVGPRAGGEPGLRYRSVRRQDATCWALLTPSRVAGIVQACHLEMIWNGTLTEVNQLSAR
ncbi:RES domain-containing protein [Halomonas sp. A11-A]|uniref:RES domain-containing protein n=1 Tax=Halomonas sp. A11-A TaxID=2183985 RepID=UPI000D714991|nr:RES domain-containing protein [Halomonas sp. A11-A]